LKRNQPFSGVGTHSRYARLPPQFIVVAGMNDPGVDCDEEKEESAKAKRAKYRKKSKSALDIHAQWTEDHDDYQHRNGRPDRLAGHSLERMVGRDFGNILISRFLRR
jgi:hypothetical protein